MTAPTGDAPLTTVPKMMATTDIGPEFWLCAFLSCAYFNFKFPKHHWVSFNENGRQYGCGMHSTLMEDYSTFMEDRWKILSIASIKEVIKLIKGLKFAIYTTRIIFTVATDQQCHEDPESSFPRAHRKCNGPGICVFLYLCLFSFLQWSRTRLWWRLGQSISWLRRRTKLCLRSNVFSGNPTTRPIRMGPGKRPEKGATLGGP